MPTPHLTLDEQQLEQLERDYPNASGVAFSNAYQQAVQAGLSVMVSENGSLFEVFPDGQRRFVKAITPPIPAQLGRKISIS